MRYSEMVKKRPNDGSSLPKRVKDLQSAPGPRLGRDPRPHHAGFAKPKDTLYALRDVSFELACGESSPSSVPNSAGKSTALS